MKRLKSVNARFKSPAILIHGIGTLVKYFFNLFIFIDMFTSLI